MRLSSGSGAVLSAVLLTGCATERPPRDTPSPSAPTLRLALRADVTGFFPNPPVADESYTYDVNWQIFEGLVRFGPRLVPEPALAETWENPDDRTYVFRLRRGLRFSDGRPVTAADVAASLTAARDRRWVTRDYLQAVEDVRATGPLTVEVRTRFPYFILLSKLPWGLVLPADASRARVVPVIGTGPYRLESWDPGRGFALTRNPYFRGPAPAFERVLHTVVPDADERLGRLQRGEADVADHVPLSAVEALSKRSDLRVFSGPGLRVLFLGLRVDRAPFDDSRVREAVALALDRQELIRRAYDGGTAPASQIVPPAVVGYNPSLPPPSTDRARSRALLGASGYGGGLSVRLDGTYNRYVNDRRILEEVARQLAAVGIRAEVNALDKRDLFPLVFSGGSTFHLLGWECQSGEAGQALDSLLHSRAGGVLGSANTTGLADGELDRLIEQANATPGSAERTLALQRALARVAALRPVVPLLIQAEAVAISRRIEWEPPLGFALRVAEMRPARR